MDCVGYSALIGAGFFFRLDVVGNSVSPAISVELLRAVVKGPLRMDLGLSLYTPFKLDAPGLASANALINYYMRHRSQCQRSN